MKKQFVYFLLGIGIFWGSCQKDETQNDNTTANSTVLYDYDGHKYKAVKIGDQIWMAENLKVTHFRNGDDIPNIALPHYGDLNHNIPTVRSGNYDLYVYPESPYMCDYSNIPSNSNTYGKLYNSFVVSDPRNIAPTGWHVATSNEYLTLFNYLRNNDYGFGGDANLIAKSLAASNVKWDTANWDPTAIVPGTIGYNPELNNSSGFSAFPGGFYDSFNSWTPLFTDGNRGGYWWTADLYRFGLTIISSSVLTEFHDYDKENKFCCLSIRCVKD